MRKVALIALLAASLAACGGSGAAPADPTPAPTEAHADDDALAGYSKGVRDYYGDEPHDVGDDPTAAIEAEYHQPPQPAEAGVGETITLTGTNIGVRMRATVTGVRRVEVKGKPYTAVDLSLESTGIAIYDGELTQATLTYAGGGEPQPVAKGVRAPCSNGFHAGVRIDVGLTDSGCLLFPADGDAQPERLQLALETVPSEAGGIWKL